MTTEKLESILNKLLSEIAAIKANWSIWNGLREEMQDGATYANLLKISPCFWSITLDNLLSKALLGTAKLYDEDKECIGLQKIINICEQNQKLFPESCLVTVIDSYTQERLSYRKSKDIVTDIKNAKEKYQSVQKFRTQLITLRDKHLAHSDKRVFLEVKEFYNEVSLKREALEKLIETAVYITNTFLLDLSDTEVLTEYYNVDDYKKTLRYVKEGKEAYLQRIRLKIKQ